MNQHKLIFQADPKGLIKESYRIPGIGCADCRSIFLDWALSLPEGLEPAVALRQLLDLHEAKAPDHPMTAIIREGLATTPVRRRRRVGRGAA